jgi:hypothetical protein
MVFKSRAHKINIYIHLQWHRVIVRMTRYTRLAQLFFYLTENDSIESELDGRIFFFEIRDTKNSFFSFKLIESRVRENYYYFYTNYKFALSFKFGIKINAKLIKK